MLKNNRFYKIYLKYLVKSQSIFYLYICSFLIFFMMISSGIQLQVRSNYDATINGNVIELVSESEIDFFDKKIYIYTDKNQKVLCLNIDYAEYYDGIMYFMIDKNKEAVSGAISVEIITGNRSLFQAIFSSAGIKR